MGRRQWAWGAVAAVPFVGLAMGMAQQSSSSGSALPSAPSAQQESVPDAPGASQNSDSLRSLTQQVAPGKAEQPSGEGQTVQAPPAPASAPGPDGPPQTEAPYQPKDAEDANQTLTKFVINTTQVIVPVTVLDKEHRQVAGLTFRDFRIYENGKRQSMNFFSVDPMPLSVAFVIDQSLQKDTMRKVNESLSAIQGAFTPQDEASVFTYGNGVTKQTDFTAVQGARLPAVLERAKKEGTDMGVPSGGGPLAAQGPTINGKIVDPNVNRGMTNALELNIPRESHTLSDAILAAAQELQSRPKERRRVIYVISDGKDVRSKANIRGVIRFLQTNNETVYATMVGDAATWGIGYLDRLHLPLLKPDNVLPRYANATGGVLESQFSTDGMERSFARLAKEIRTQYTLGYKTSESSLDGRYRVLDVHVERPNLDVKAPVGYYPNASMQHQ